MDVGAVILAGGKSARMEGRDKALLPLGNARFLERLLSALDGFGEVLVSTDRAGRYPGLPVPAVPDRFPGTGPLGGLCSALAACRSEALLTVPCDVPLFSRELASYLRALLSPGQDAWILTDRSGRDHPLCGVYHKSALAAMERQLEAGNFRMRDLLGRLRVKRVPLGYTVFPDSCVANVNTPEDYRQLLREVAGPAVVAVSGVKNAGKTTLLTRLIPPLRTLGYRLAVVKHDGHDFRPDVPGTDSDRFRQAGADAVAVYSSNRYLCIRQGGRPCFEDLAGLFSDVDLILVEGLKDSRYPKIEVVRGAVSRRPVCDPSTLLAIMTDVPLPDAPCPVLDLDDTSRAVALIDRHTRAAAPW